MAAGGSAPAMAGPVSDQDAMLQQQPHTGPAPDLEALKNMPPAMLQQLLGGQ